MAVGHIEALSVADRWRGLAAVIGSAGCVGVTIGYLAPLIAYLLEQQGYPNWAIGLNGAAAALATILLGPLVPKVFQRVGFFHAILLSVFGEALLILALLALPGLWVWLAIRFLMGVCITLHWIGSETWIVAAAPPGQRGRAIALYMIAISAGFAAGPLVIQVTGTDGPLPFLVAAALVLLSAPLLWLARETVPKLPHAPKAAIAQAFRIAPLMLTAALLAGFVDMSALTHLVNYGRDAGLGEDTAFLMLTLMLTSNAIMQFPVGWLADRVNSRNLLIVFGTIFFVAPLLLIQTVGQGWAMWPVLIVFGIASMGIYTVALTLLGERFEAGMIASANAAIVALYQFGGLTGPPASGSAMDLLGPDGLMLVFSAAGLCFLAFAAYRTWVRRRRGITDPTQPLEPG